MGQTVSTRFEVHATKFSAVDAEAGVITGVSVITEGPALGHFDWESQKPLYVDATTLQQVKACAETYGGGLKVKMDHGSGVSEIVAVLKNFALAGAQLRADLHLLKTTPHRAYILEIATTLPESFGLSIAFSGPAEVSGDRAMARCTEIYSADLVSEPAANPTGLFSAKRAGNPGDDPGQIQNQKPIHMASESDPKPEDPIAAMSAALSALAARLQKLEDAANPPAEDAAKMSAKLNQVAELAAENAFKKFAAQLGTPPAQASGESAKKDADAPKKFEDLVKAHPDYAKNKAFAVSDTVAKHPAEHSAYLARCRSGEVTLF